MSVTRPLANTLIVLGFVILALAAAILGLAPHGANSSNGVGIAVFLGQLVAVAVIIVGFGALPSQTLWGFALSSRNAYSLSKLQMAGWTVLVLAALFTAAEIRIFGYFGAVKDPLQITIPGDLLAAMGISVFTTAATPAILALKSTGTPTGPQEDAAAQRLANQTKTTKDNIDNVGHVMVRADQTLARWSDIVSGDEVANAGTTDLSKVQQLLITLLLLGTYTGMVVSAIASRNVFDSLPLLSTYFVGLMAISHAGYLTYKAVPKPAPDSQQQPTPQQTAALPAMVGPSAAPPRQG
jgi:hypothetical protein